MARSEHRMHRTALTTANEYGRRGAHGIEHRELIGHLGFEPMAQNQQARALAGASI